jgi:hypothetical protein
MGTRLNNVPQGEKFGSTPLGAQEGNNKNKRPREKSRGLIVFVVRYPD